VGAGRHDRVGRAALKIMDAELETSAREICGEVFSEMTQADEPVAHA
jgi:hypothetical protein